VIPLEVPKIAEIRILLPARVEDQTVPMIILVMVVAPRREVMEGVHRAFDGIRVSVIVSCQVSIVGIVEVPEVPQQPRMLPNLIASSRACGRRGLHVPDETLSPNPGGGTCQQV